SGACAWRTSSSDRTSRSNSIRTPSPCARAWRICSSALRSIPQNPCPVDRRTSPPNWISMSSQRANRLVISACVSGSAAARLPSVASENTTPNPNVSAGRLRSKITTSCSGALRLTRMPRYSPAGPPPMQAIFTASTYQIRDRPRADARRSGLGELLEALERRAEVGALGEDRRARIARPASDAIERIAQVELLGVETGDDLVPGERHR